MSSPRFYRTDLGEAMVGDALKLIKRLDAKSVQAIVTSPPFALLSPKKYGNVTQTEYVEWFKKFAMEFKRVLRSDGSLVIEIGGSWLPGTPTRSIYHFELLVALVRDCGYHLAQEFYWYNRAKLPGPAQWVTIQRTRVKDAVNPIWWLSPSPDPIAHNRDVLRPYSQGMLDLFKRGYNKGARPSGHVVGSGFAVNHGGAIPPNLIEVANTQSGDLYQDYCRSHGLKPHPARFPVQIPTFFIKFLTKPGDLVLDPFAGSNVTGAVAESLGRRWVAFEEKEEYVAGSIGRFLQAKGYKLIASPGTNVLQEADAADPKPEAKMPDGTSRSAKSAP